MGLDVPWLKTKANLKAVVAEDVFVFGELGALFPPP